MLEFLKAAFPWVVIGVCVAIIAAGYTAKRRQQAAQPTAADGEKKKAENCQSEGMCIGMSLGVVLGTTGICDLATGISLGMLLGLVIGMSIKK